METRTEYMQNTHQIRGASEIVIELTKRTQGYMVPVIHSGCKEIVPQIKNYSFTQVLHRIVSVAYVNCHKTETL